MLSRWGGRLHVSLLGALLALPLLGGLPGLSNSRTTGPLPGHYFADTYIGAAGTRNYLGYSPSGSKDRAPLPLVVVLHGCTQSAGTLRQQTRFDKLAEANQFIVVYPEQPSSANAMHCWNWFNQTDIHRGSGEASIIAGITDRVGQHYVVDPRRVYVAGFSAGGAMAAVMGATYPDTYAAIGVGSGIPYGGPNLGAEEAGRVAYTAMGPFARPMPTLVFHGGQDTVVPAVNADKLVRQWRTAADLADDGTMNESVPATPASTLVEQPAGRRLHTVTRYDDGQGRELIQSWRVPGMGHAWSGGCACTTYSDPAGPDEAQAMYDFFVNHVMPHP